MVSHLYAARHARRDYLLQVDLGPYGLVGQSEQLWLTPAEGSVYRVACLPFCVCGLAYDDLVDVDIDRRVIVRITEPSRV